MLSSSAAIGGIAMLLDNTISVEAGLWAKAGATGLHTLLPAN
jgi:hypothetical protein